MPGELILVIEDHETNRKLVRDVLGFRGYAVAEATNGEDGIELARTRRPGLILMDIHMPGMDGITALKHLRSDPATRPIPVIALTASAMPDDRKLIEAAGFDAYETKPISVRRLLDVIERLLAEGRS